MFDTYRAQRLLEDLARIVIARLTRVQAEVVRAVGIRSATLAELLEDQHEAARPGLLEAAPADLR